MTRMLGLLAALAMAGWVSSGWAQAPASSSPATPAAGPASAAAAPTTTCQDTGRFDPPQLPWMGRVVLQLTLTHQAGQVLDAQVKPMQPLDAASDKRLAEAMVEHVKAHLRCQGPESPTTLYLAVRLSHDLRALAKAWADAGGDSALPLPSAPVNAVQACAITPRPDFPQSLPNQAVGVWRLHLLASVRQSKVTYTSIKLVQGSPDARLNQLFLKATERAAQRDYQCAGDQVIEQEFVFKLAGD